MKLSAALLSALYFADIAASYPIPSFQRLAQPTANKKNENDLFLDRWQQNFGSRLTKPAAAAAPILTIPTDIRPAGPAAIPGILSDILNPAAQKPASLSAPPNFDPGKLYAIPLDALQPPPHRATMHGALDFLKPAAALPAEPAKDWRDWVPLSDSSARVGTAVPEAAKRVFSAPMPAGLFTKKPQPQPQPPTFVMPANTMTKAELVRQIVAQAPPPGACPGCGGDVYESGDGWKSRFAAWVREVWRRVVEAIMPAHI